MFEIFLTYKAEKALKSTLLEFHYVEKRIYLFEKCIFHIGFLYPNEFLKGLSIEFSGLYTWMNCLSF
jgi:hypothetical protein